MMKLTVLGCGSAILTHRRFCSSQVIDVDGELYMIDCGEATQMQFFDNNLKQSRLNNIFISHLHGDHCLGLVGFLSSLSLLNRTKPINIYGPSETECIFRPLLAYFCGGMSFEVRFKTVSVTDKTNIFEDRQIRVYAFPLCHRVECYGFLFEEREKERHIKADCIATYHIPYTEVPNLKQGRDYVTTEGTVISNELLTNPPSPSRQFAYCSDTSITENTEKAVEGVDLLYHETTYLQSEHQLAASMSHATTVDVAELAKRAKVKKLLIGHFSNRHTDDNEFLNEVSSIFPNVTAAFANMRIEI